jgi:hypothetical protein
VRRLLIRKSAELDHTNRQALGSGRAQGRTAPGKSSRSSYMQTPPAEFQTSDRRERSGCEHNAGGFRDRGEIGRRYVSERITLTRQIVEASQDCQVGVRVVEIPGVDKPGHIQAGVEVHEEPSAVGGELIT